VELRRLGSVRLVTNTTSRSRREIFEHLRELGFEVELQEVLTPAAMALRHCRERGFESVALLVSERLREDLSALERHERAGDGKARTDAVILGDLGSGFTADVLNGAFRQLMDGAELVALQPNRYWLRADGLALDVGAYAAAHFRSLRCAEAGIAHVARELAGTVQVGPRGEVEQHAQRRRGGALALGVGTEHVEHGHGAPGLQDGTDTIQQRHDLLAGEVVD